MKHNTKGNEMKKELVLLGSMIAMSGALSSCCCKKAPAYGNSVPPAPKVVNYKDGGHVYTPSQSAYYTPVQQPVVTRPAQPVVRYVPVQQAPVHPVTAAAGMNAAVQAHVSTQNIPIYSSSYNSTGGYSTGSGYGAYGYGTYNRYYGYGHRGCSHPVLIRKNGCPVGPYVTQPCLYR